MGTKKEVKALLLNVLGEYLDTCLAELHFSRRKNSLIYNRKIGDVVQEINIQLNYKPKYQPGVDAHIYPMIRIMIPKVSEIALQMVSGQKLILANAPEIIINQPLEMTAPKEHHARWFATLQEEFISVIGQIKTFINEWSLSFLRDYNSIDGLVRGYEKNDERLMRQQHWYIYIAAAFVLLNRIEDARQVVEDKFGKPGLKSRFSALFEYFESIGSR